MSSKRGNTEISGTLSAFTLPEILVYMVLAGIVFLVAMDGFVLFRRYAAGRTEKIIGNMEFYDGYHRLATVCHAADSVVSDDYGRITLFLRSEPTCRIFLEDSLTMISGAGYVDTLFDCSPVLRLIKRVPNRPGADSVYIELVRNGGHSLTLTFAIRRQAEKIADTNIEEQENEYVYE